MIGVSKTFGGSSILSSPALKEPEASEIHAFPALLYYLEIKGYEPRIEFERTEKFLSYKGRGDFMKQYLTLSVSTETGSVEHFLRAKAGLTRRQISRAKFSENGILKNGIRCRSTEEISPGDMITVCLEEENTGSSHLIPPPSDMIMPAVLYEDSDLIAVNKPAGIPVHPSGKHYNDTLSNQLFSYFSQNGQQFCCRSIGRLDKETSGIVLFAKNRPAASLLQKQRNEGKLLKQYLAAVSGYLPVDTEKSWHTTSFPVMPDPCNPLKMQVLKTAAYDFHVTGKVSPKSAVTHYRTFYSTPDWSLVLLRLETGRTHQIRVHMAASGHPLLGDPLYGDNRNMPVPHNFQRTALHAWKMEFFHPFTQKRVFLSAALPDDFTDIAKKAGLPQDVQNGETDAAEWQRAAKL